jgi:preprotein translocase subunit SecE
MGRSLVRRALFLLFMTAATIVVFFGVGYVIGKLIL